MSADLDADSDQAETVSEQGPEPSLEPEAAGQVWITASDDRALFDYDDDDDLDDFDDLDLLDGMQPPKPVEPARVFPEINLDDMSSPEEDDDPLPLVVDLAENGDQGKNVGNDDQGENADGAESESRPLAADDEEALLDDTLTLDDPLPLDDPSPDEETGADQPTDHQSAELDRPAPSSRQSTRHQPLEDEPASAAEAAAGEKTPARLDEGIPSPPDNSLALQPIPELQTAPRSAGGKAPDLQISEEAAAALFDDDGDENGDRRTSSAEDTSSNVTALDIQDLEIGALDANLPDQADDGIAEDWHARLAEVLCSDRSLKDTRLPAVRPDPAPDGRDRQAAVLPLSKTLAQLATARAAEDEGDEPMPPILIRTARQQAIAVGAPPSPLSIDAAGLSQEQLAIAIIANVSRLRRFAAIQIGDELVADHLVQTTIEASLADPSILRPDRDLGLALMMVLYRRRQQMLADPGAMQRPPEAGRAFETELCRGLAGADQFEVNAFAQAINALKETDREVLVLVALENLAYDQIAELLRVPMEQIMAKVANARMSLRRALAADNPDVNGPAATGSHKATPDIPHDQEIEIHGYLDGELDGRHMADVDALVEYDEDAADRLLHYGIQGDLIRRLYAPLINRPLPIKMLDALSFAAKPVRRGFRFGPRRALIAGAVVIALGASVAWLYIAPTLSGVVSEAMAISSIAGER